MSEESLSCLYRVHSIFCHLSPLLMSRPLGLISDRRFFQPGQASPVFLYAIVCLVRRSGGMYPGFIL